NKKDLLNYIIVQVISGLIAVISVHYIFQIDLFQVSSNIRGEFPLLVSEIIATFGLVLTILLIRENDEKSVAIGVALFITAGYWFTSSTSFANPAVTISRVFTDTFTGIAPESLLYFLCGQIIGCIIANYTFNIFDKK
ncbi:MAG: aquaporin family protein, partial [Candidatus Marinimicrobia bacterium]|nr:aquaporin family protein [Candidatus Neomarinimicrobiota bacterium]